MRILSVDDDAKNLYLIEAMFSAKDYVVFSAHNGAEALDALEKEPFDLIISDILMPEVDGWQLCYEVKNNENWKFIPFIFYTATYTSKKDEEFAMSLGASRFIIKPAEPENFITIINSIVKESKNAVPGIPRLEFSDELRFVKAHNERLVSKLNQKVSQLQKSNEKLKAAIEEKDTEIIGRIHTEDSLRKSEELYHSLFDSMLNGFAYCKMIFDNGKPVDFMYIAVNNSFEKQTGLKNVTSRKVSEIIPGIYESDPELFNRYGRVALNGEPEEFEIFVEGLKMWFSISVYSPEKEYFVAVFDVITERKQTEEALRKSEERLRHAAEAAEFGIYSYDFETGKAYYSPEHLALYDLPPDSTIELDSDLTAKALLPIDKPAFLAAMKEANNPKGSKSGILDIEFRIIIPDGNIRWLKVRGRTTFGKYGQPVRSDGVVQDITKRK
jgi:PAS domain S-box-containing protein